jgi:hypothetical protein
MTKKGCEPEHENVLTFLDNMSNKFAGCSKLFAHRKGMTGEISELASIRAIE